MCALGDGDREMTRESSQLIVGGREWRIGLIMAGDSKGSAVLVWPLGTDHFDLVFDVAVDFMGDRSDDPFVFSASNKSALSAIDELEVDWWAPGNESLLAARQHFPESRAALGEVPDGGSD